MNMSDGYWVNVRRSTLARRQFLRRTAAFGAAGGADLVTPVLTGAILAAILMSKGKLSEGEGLNRREPGHRHRAPCPQHHS